MLLTALIRYYALHVMQHASSQMPSECSIEIKRFVTRHSHKSETSESAKA